MKNGKRCDEETEDTPSSGVVLSNKGNMGKVIRVGKNFQACCPKLEPVASRRPDLLDDRALTVWLPSENLSDDILKTYITLAKEKYGHNEEQALAIILSNNYNTNQAIPDLAHFRPLSEEWSIEDQMLFEQAFQIYGKNFNRIKDMLPEKNISSLLKYYYSWKKSKFRIGLIDKKVRELISDRKQVTVSKVDLDSGSSNEESESDYIEKPKGKSCQNCDAVYVNYMSSTRGFCHPCYQHWKRTGKLQPTSELGTSSNKRPVPSDIHLNYDDLVKIVSGNEDKKLLHALDREFTSVRHLVQGNKRQMKKLKKTLLDRMADAEASCPFMSYINPGWTNEEINLAVKGVRNYKNNCKRIAKTLVPEVQFHLENMYKDFEKVDGPGIVSSDEIMQSGNMEMDLN